MARKERLVRLPGTYAVVRLPPHTRVLPAWLEGDFVSVTRTAEELSLVLLQEQAQAIQAERDARVDEDWRLLRVEGPLDFALVGVLASLLEPLRERGISVFALSTYDTDYLLTAAVRSDDAIEALRAAGHHVTEPPQGAC